MKTQRFCRLCGEWFELDRKFLKPTRFIWNIMTVRYECVDTTACAERVKAIQEAAHHGEAEEVAV